MKQVTPISSGTAGPQGTEDSIHKLMSELLGFIFLVVHQSKGSLGPAIAFCSSSTYESAIWSGPGNYLDRSRVSPGRSMQCLHHRPELTGYGFRSGLHDESTTLASYDGNCVGPDLAFIPTHAANIGHNTRS